jgi:hypothetical protein
MDAYAQASTHAHAHKSIHASTHAYIHLSLQNMEITTAVLNV